MRWEKGPLYFQKYYFFFQLFLSLCIFLFKQLPYSSRISFVLRLSFSVLIVYLIGISFSGFLPHAPKITSAIIPEIMVSLPEDVAHPLPPKEILTTITVCSNETIANVLIKTGISKFQSREILASIKKVFNEKNLKKGQKIFLTFEEEEKDRVFKKIEFMIGAEESIVLNKDAKGRYCAQKITRPLTKEIRKIDGTIRSSLAADALRAGVPTKIIQELIRIYSFDVNFAFDVKQNDRFVVLYETKIDKEKGIEKPGEILFACLFLGNEKIPLYRFSPKGEASDFYKPSGENIKKELLSMPINGAKLSSSFGKRRHPMLGFTAFHKGIDLSAPQGTPIVSAGKGVIEEIKRHPTYGNYIRIRHNKEISTFYAHLSRYASGIKNGQSVRQGQVIGFVGRTGRATGNHLHFELKKCGQSINPSSIRKLPSQRLSSKELQNFYRIRDEIHRLLKEKGGEPII